MPSEAQEKLRQLVGRRTVLMKMRSQERLRKKGPTGEYIQESLLAVIEVLDQELEKVEKSLKELIKANAQMKEKLEIMKEVEGVGDTTGIMLLGMMPELGKLENKQAASLAGLAPHPNSSGGQEGYRRVRGGREGIKTVMYMAAMAASRSESKLGDFYDRLVERGKKKLVAQTAVARKMIVIVNAKLREYEGRKAMGDT